MQHLPFPDRRAIRGTPDHRDLKEIQVMSVLKDYRECPDLLDQLDLPDQ